MTFSAFDIVLADTVRKLYTIVEADIRGAYGEAIVRPSVEVPDYIYAAAVRSEDEDLRAHDAEVSAQLRRLQEP
jgi:hypothetical protein